MYVDRANAAQYALSAMGTQAEAAKHVFAHKIKKNVLKKRALGIINNDVRFLTKLSIRDTNNYRKIMPYIKTANKPEVSIKSKQEATNTAVDLLFNDNLTENQALKFEQCISEYQENSFSIEDKVNDTKPRIFRSKNDKEIFDYYKKMCSHTRYDDESKTITSHKVIMLNPMCLPGMGSGSVDCIALEELKSTTEITKEQIEKYGLTQGSRIHVETTGCYQTRKVNLDLITTLFIKELSSQNDFLQSVGSLYITFRIKDDVSICRTIRRYKIKLTGSEGKGSILCTYWDFDNSENNKRPTLFPGGTTIAGQHNVDIVFRDFQAFDDLINNLIGYNEGSYNKLEKEGKIRLESNSSTRTDVEKTNSILKDVLNTESQFNIISLMSGVKSENIEDLVFLGNKLEKDLFEPVMRDITKNLD